MYLVYVIISVMLISMVDSAVNPNSIFGLCNLIVHVIYNYLLHHNNNSLCVLDYKFYKTEIHLPFKAGGREERFGCILFDREELD